MRGLLIKNAPEKISISAYNYYGANFSLNVFDQISNTYDQQNLAMTEGVEPVTAVTATCNDPRTAGQEIISVVSATGLTVGDRISLNSYIYRIKSIAVGALGDDITLHLPLYSAVVGTETVTLVGNMGVYSLDLTMSTVGEYLVQAKDSVFGIQHSDSIKVVAKSVEQLFTDTNVNIDQNQTLITTSKSGWKVLI